jgi:2'-5' RNA ligase
LSAGTDSLPKHIRAFIAVRIPRNVLEELGTIQQKLQLEFHDVSWTRPEAMHLTLQFLGNVESNRLESLTEILSAAARVQAVFKVELSALGSFNNRVLWVGIGRGAAELTSLAESMRSLAKDFGDHREERSFSAHVTLGRFRQRARGVELALQKISPPHFTAWSVDHVELIRSELSPRGSRYTTLASFNLS